MAKKPRKSRPEPLYPRKVLSSENATSRQSLKALLDFGKECKNLDFKSDFDPTKSGAWQEILKDVVAFANAGGGFIVVGATNSGTPSGADLTVMKRLDQAQYVDQMHKYSNTDFGEIDITFHSIKGQTFGLVRIGCALPPIIFSKEGYYRTPNGKDERAFSKGVIYTRHGSKSEPATQTDLHRWFNAFLKSMKSELLKNVRKVVGLPPDQTVLTVPKGYRITQDLSAPAVRLTADPSAPELPYKLPLTTEEYTSLQEEFIGAVKAWKTDPLAYTPQSQLWKFYIARERLSCNAEAIRCLLISSMYQHCPFYYWASRLTRNDLEKVLWKEANRDSWPGIHVVVRLAFAIGGQNGKALLKSISAQTKYTSAKKLAKRLKNGIEEDRIVWDEYRSPSRFSVSINGEDTQIDLTELISKKLEFANLITKLASQENTRDITKRLDPLRYGQF